MRKFILFISFFVSVAAFAYTLKDTPRLGIIAHELSKLPEWNLSISPTGKGLPAGSGTANQGEKIFAKQCSTCHGPQGIGGSAQTLVGEVGTLKDTYPEKTVNSYWPYAPPLFDYIRRAMPIEKPFSLSANEVYALSAYILSQDNIIGKDEVMNADTLAKVIMPNRDGFIAVYPNEIKAK